MNKNIVYEKNGYILRLAKESDAEDYYNQNFNPLNKEVVRLTGSKEFFSKEEVVTFFYNSLKDDNRLFFLIISPDGRIIGESIVNEIDWNVLCGNFRIAIFQPSEWGKGIGTWAIKLTRDIAFTELKLQRLELTVFSFNYRAKHAYLKAGFKQYSILDNNKLMAILKEDWDKIKNNNQ